jgi:hypothetical protein
MENLLEPDLIPTQHSSLFLQVWQQAVQSVRIGRWDDGRSSQMTLTLAWLMCQLMAHKSMLHLVFAGCRLAETLGGTSFSLHLWHSGLEKKPPLRSCKPHRNQRLSWTGSSHQVFWSISSRILARTSSTGMGPRSLPLRKRTATLPAATSRSPTTSMYGIFSVCASRIL